MKRLTAFLAVLVVLAGVGEGVAAPISATLGYFRFEETPAGSHNTWTNSQGTRPNGESLPTNGVVNTSDVFGSTVPLTGGTNSTSLWLDGSDAVLIGWGDDYDIGTNDFTVEAWIKSSGGRGSTFNVAAKTQYGKKAYGWQFGVADGSDDEVYWDIRRGASEKIVVWGATDVLDDQWHHVAGVLDRSAAEVRVYVDGELDASPTHWPFGSSSLDGEQDTYVGRRGGSRQDFFQGSIDEVRITAAALRPSELLLAPEPSTFALLAMGALALLVYAWRRRKVA